MAKYLFQMSDITLFIFLSFIAILLSIAAVFFVRRFIPLEIRYKDNSVIGAISGIISIIYGVLAGLTALYLINNINYTADAVQREANAVANLYRESQSLNEPTKSQIQQEIKNYLVKVIHTEWSLMQNGNDLDQENDLLIHQMSNQLSTYPLTNNLGILIVRSMLEDIKILYDTRQQRVSMSFSGLSPEIWIVILIGSIFTIAINFLFGMNFYLHIITVSAAALMTASIIFLLVTLDKPFQGDFIVGPNAFESLLTLIEKMEKNPLPHSS